MGGHEAEADIVAGGDFTTTNREVVVLGGMRLPGSAWWDVHAEVSVSIELPDGRLLRGSGVVRLKARQCGRAPRKGRGASGA